MQQLTPQSKGPVSLVKPTETPLKALVKNAISSIRSQSVSKSLTPEISEKVLALRSTYNMVDISDAFNTDLQTQLAYVKDIATIHDVDGVPTLRMLEHAYGFKYASRVWIKTQLVIVNDFSGTREKLNDMQIDTLSDQILIEYGGLNLMEFCLFCSRLRSGKYEQFFGSVDPSRILSSLEKFIKDWREDINRAAAERERVEREREREEQKKNAVRFEDWLASLPPEEQEQARINFRIVSAEDKDNRHNGKKSFAKRIGEFFT